MTIDNINYTAFLDSLLRGDRAYCSQVIKNELKNNPPIFELYEQLIRKSLYEIGELWENNEISTATEHLASAIIEAILNEIYPEVISSEKKTNRLYSHVLKMRDIRLASKWSMMYLN